MSQLSPILPVKGISGLLKTTVPYKYLGQGDRSHFSVLVIRFKYVVEFNATVFGIPCLLITYYEGICLWQ